MLAAPRATDPWAAGTPLQIAGAPRSKCPAAATSSQQERGLTPRSDTSTANAAMRVFGRMRAALFARTAAGTVAAVADGRARRRVKQYRRDGGELWDSIVMGLLLWQ